MLTDKKIIMQGAVSWRGKLSMAIIEDFKNINYTKLINPTFIALKKLGGVGTTSEIQKEIIEKLSLSKEAVSCLHNGRKDLTELQYHLAWARTYLKKAGIIDNVERGIWKITLEYDKIDSINEKEIIKAHAKKFTENRKRKLDKLNRFMLENEIKSEMRRLVHKMTPIQLEKLIKEVAKEKDSSKINITKRYQNGFDGILDTQKLGHDENSFFRMIKTKNNVKIKDILDFQKDFPTNIIRGVFMTTSTISERTKIACYEQMRKKGCSIVLLNLEDVLNVMFKIQIGIKRVDTYVVNKNFFEAIKEE